MKERKMKKVRKKLKGVISFIIGLISVIGWKVQLAFAAVKDEGPGSIENSKLVTGTVNLGNDIQKSLLVVIPVTTVVLALWFFSKLQGADETDEKPIKKKIKVVIVSGIVCFCIDALVGIILGYYK